ncbi:MAG: hypothetical protein WCF04_03470 [Candidatus Nanopelagicales bacterium]
MSRTFWMAVGAAGGIVAYRKGTQVVSRARELGPVGSAQVAARATSQLAGRTADGLGRLRDWQARRDGRLVVGSVAASAAPAQSIPAQSIPAQSIPAHWVPVAAGSADRAAAGGMR